jgi:hypothetical protein
VLHHADAASRFRWIVAHHGEIGHFVFAIFSISCADRCLLGAAPDV